MRSRASGVAVGPRAGVPETEDMELFELRIVPQSKSKTLALRVPEEQAMGGPAVADRRALIANAEGVFIGSLGGEELRQRLRETRRDSIQKGRVGFRFEVLGNERGPLGDSVLARHADAPDPVRAYQQEQKSCCHGGTNDLPLVHLASAVSSIGLSLSASNIAKNVKRISYR